MSEILKPVLDTNQRGSNKKSKLFQGNSPQGMAGLRTLNKMPS